MGWLTQIFVACLVAAPFTAGKSLAPAAVLAVAFIGLVALPSDLFGGGQDGVPVSARISSTIRTAASSVVTSSVASAVRSVASSAASAVRNVGRRIGNFFRR